MIIYRISYSPEEGPGTRRYARSSDAARSVVAGIKKERLHDFSKGKPTVEKVEIASGKTAIVDFLNSESAALTY